MPLNSVMAFGVFLLLFFFAAAAAQPQNVIVRITKPIWKNNQQQQKIDVATRPSGALVITINNTQNCQLKHSAYALYFVVFLSAFLI